MLSLRPSRLAHNTFHCLHLICRLSPLAPLRRLLPATAAAAGRAFASAAAGVGFLLSAFFTVFIFAVLLSVLVLCGVLWDSAAIGIMAAFAMMVITPILAQKSTLERLLDSEWSRDVVRVLYYVLPKTSDISLIIRHLILGQAIDSWMPVWSTALFGVAVLGAGLWRFERRSF